MGNDPGTKLMIPQGKPDCTEEQGDTTSRQDGGTISCQGNYMQLLEGDKSLRGPKVSSSPNSKGSLFTYLFVSKNTCTPDAAFQQSIKLLKTLMTTGNVVLISCFLPVTATQKEPNADMNHLSHHHCHPSRSHVCRATHHAVWETIWARGGVHSSGLLEPDHPLVGTENGRFLGCPHEAGPQPHPAPKFLCFLVSFFWFPPLIPST